MTLINQIHLVFYDFPQSYSLFLSTITTYPFLKQLTSFFKASSQKQSNNYHFIFLRLWHNINMITKRGALNEI